MLQMELIRNALIHMLLHVYFGGLGSSTNRTFPSRHFIPRATRRPLLELSIHVCAILEIAPHFKAFSNTREKF